MEYFYIYSYLIFYIISYIFLFREIIVEDYKDLFFFLIKNLNDLLEHNIGENKINNILN